MTWTNWLLGSGYEWLHLGLRWFHVLAGIFWIGQTALFGWLDTRFRVEGGAGDSPDEGVWMIHSGGFYRVHKEGRPERLPGQVHWFRWEAALTWLSGVSLLVVVYYLGGVLVEPGGAGRGLAVSVGLGALALAWVAYDAIWMSRLARSERLAAGLCLGLLIALAYALSTVLSGRAAYIHVGAAMGTIMAANVWMRILPAQRQLVAAVESGSAPDAALAGRAKQRSKHNTFLAVPLVFLMISSHFPTTSYGHRWNWLMLAVFLGLGFVARWLLDRHEANP